MVIHELTHSHRMIPAPEPRGHRGHIPQGAPDGRLDLRIDYTRQLSHLGLSHNTVLQSVVPSAPPSDGLLPAS